VLYYIALTWNPNDPSADAAAIRLRDRFQQSSPSWKTAVRAPGLIASYCITSGPTVDRPYVLPNERGVIFGRLFRRIRTEGIAPEQGAFDDETSSRLIDCGGRTLMEQYWGRYVAFLRSPDTADRWIIRDPSGGLPCYRTALHGVDIYFVRLEDCERTGTSSFSINHQFVLGMLGGSFGFVRDTGLKEITNLLPGECVELRSDQRKSTFYWNPFEQAASANIENFAEAVQELRQTVRTCVWSWASCFDGILLRLSGGLDSSIVLSCLAESPAGPRVICQNEYAAGTRADEREFARLAAQRARCELIEENVDQPFRLQNLLGAPRAVSPHVRVFNREAARGYSQKLHLAGITAIFNGHGGDEIFYKGNTVPTSTDYAWRHGLSTALFEVALNDSVRSKLNVWKVLGKAIRHGIFKQDWPFGARGRTHALIPEAILEDAREQLAFAHPLYQDAPAMPPGQKWHAYSVSSHSAVFWPPDPVESLPVSLSPLLSQPLMELSLRIPTYTLCEGGRDRSVAREAFQLDVPKEIVMRSAKGTPEERAWKLLFENAPLARELLLDGYLVQTGCLKREQLVNVLSGEPTHMTGFAADFLTYLNIESWARNWPTGTRLQAVA
jgi:asparagine synthase (glutamine-hydrolysing)